MIDLVIITFSIQWGVCLFSRSRRQLAALNKECQFGFSAESEEPNDLDATMAYYQLDDAGDAVFPSLPVRKPNLQEPDDAIQDQMCNL